MGKRIFSPRERPLAQALANLILNNPFSEERRRLERDILESSGWERSERSDLASILALLEDLLRTCRAQIQQTALAPNSPDSALYQELVLLHLFHMHRRDFDRVIEVSHARGSAEQRIPFYERFIRELRYWLPGGLCGEYANAGEAVIFAMFFQVRRAFQHLYQNIVGTSPAALRLRERLWTSLFTSRMDRYRKMLSTGAGLNHVVTVISGPGGSGKEQTARALALSRYIPFDPQRNEFEADFLKGFIPVRVQTQRPAILQRHLIRSERYANELRNQNFSPAQEAGPDDFALGDLIDESGPATTVFFDEVAHIEPPLQSALLALLHLRDQPLGGIGANRFFQGHVMMASKSDLATLVERGRLSEELYFRLGADSIRLQPLSAILQESPAELGSLLLNIARKYVGIEEAEALAHESHAVIARQLPPNYGWPGNYRELEQCVRSVLMQGNYTPAAIASGNSPSTLLAGEIERGSLTVDALLTRYITHLFAQSPNYEEIGRRLGIDRRTVKKYVRPGG